MRVERTVHRALLGLATLAVAAGTTFVGPAAQAAPSERRADAVGAADWMVSQLRGDLLSTQETWGLNKLYGPTLDGVISLNTVNAYPAQRAAMLDAVEAEIDAYTGARTDGETYVGALGKLLTAAQVEGRRVRSVGDGTQLRRLEDRVRTGKGAQRGRVSDKSQYGDYSSTFSQVWAVRALAQAGSTKRAISTSFLLKQQCAAGFFRASFESRNFTCQTAKVERRGDRTPDVDATALAVAAMKDARRSGVKGLGRRHHRRAAVAGLRPEQRRVLHGNRRSQQQLHGPRRFGPA